MPATVDLAPAPVPAVPQGAVEPCSPQVAAIARLGMVEAFDGLSADRARAALAVVAFLFTRRETMPTVALIEALCQVLLEAGLPLDRYGSSTSMVTSEHDAVGRLWLRGQGVEQMVYVRPEDEDPVYLASPFRVAAETMSWVEVWLPTTPDDRFGIVPSLKAQGFVHYLCMPIRLGNGAMGWVTVATRRATGFSHQDLLTIAFILPPLAGRIDTNVGWTTLDKLLRTYVGDEPHTAILAGRAKRGQVTTIEAAMLVADLRDSTGHTADLSPVEAVGLFNDLFDGLVPSIESRHGEVLKYLGDGLLGMFRDIDGSEGACARALEAAEAALAAIEAFNTAHPARRPMHVGIALHHGHIAYGNVGSGARLDFTAIGRDVALATRLADMNGPLGENLLLSASFVARLGRPASRLGLYPARGFADPVEVFRPAVLPNGAEANP